ncbi:MAG: pyruvate, phosphate dikinase, partial [Chloroflexi bacterium]
VEADSELDADALHEVAEAFLTVVRSHAGREFPTDPLEQLDLAVKAVFASWYGRRAHDYREYNKIPHDLGTAVNVVAMVFGNLGEDSGTGVAFTRNPNTGEKALYGEYLTNAQGEDVVAGIRTPSPIAALRDEMPQVYDEFQRIGERLEAHYRDVQDLEFTIERGRLYMLQTRSAKRTAPAAVRIAVEMVNEGIITRDEALQRVEPGHVVQLLLPRFDDAARSEAAERRLCTGLNASPGAATGRAMFDPDRAVEAAKAGDPVILVRIETSPDDVHGMLVAKGVLTARGGATSHAAVVARSLGLPCVAGAEALDIDYEARSMRVGSTAVAEGDTISIDGTTGELYTGALATIDPNFDEERDLATLLAWADEVRRLQVWANADYPRDAERARSYGAQGIGLCRTEHMFFEESRLPTVRQMILVASDATAAKARRDAGETLSGDDEEAIATFDAALAALEQTQTDDFAGHFRAMDGLPVVIRLIDPPLHEFLPSHDELLVEVTLLRERGTDEVRLAELEETLAAVESMREQNPMLGMRGVRLGLMIPDIVRMQTRAILTAAAQVAAEGVTPLPEIMIPLVGHANELRETRTILEAEARAVAEASGQSVAYKFGTMIEVPRG